MPPISPNISPSSSTANLSTLSSDGSSGEYEWTDALPEFENPWKSSDQETDATLSRADAESSTKDKMAYITSLARGNLQPPTKSEQQPNDVNADGKEVLTPKTIRFSSSLQQIPFTQNNQSTSKLNPLLRLTQQSEQALRSTSTTTLMPNDSPFRGKAEKFSIPSSKAASDNLKKTQEIHDYQEIALEGGWEFNLDNSETYEITPEDDSSSTLDVTD